LGYVHFLGVWCQFPSFLNCIPFYLFYFISTIIINNPIIYDFFCSRGPFILPSFNFLLVVKLPLQLDFVFSFEGRWYISKLAQVIDLASSPGTAILQELPRVAVASQGYFGGSPGGP
jgi:hypothetical protein